MRVYWLALTVVLAIASDGLVAEEPSEAFLAELRAGGYFELADAYLERMETSQLAAAAFKESLEFERAVNLTEIAKQQADLEGRATTLKQALGRFRSFADSNPSHSKAPMANEWVRNLTLQQARTSLATAESTDGDQQEKLLKAASSEFKLADKAFKAEIERLQTELEAFEELPRESQQSSVREQLRSDYLEAQMVSATIAYESAAPLKPDEKKYKRQLGKADKAFQELSEKYRTRLVGLHAVLLKGKCQQDLGNTKEALALYRELLDPTGQPEPVVLISAEAATLTMECLTTGDATFADEAIRVGEQWLAAARSANVAAPQVQKLQFTLGKTYALRMKTGGGNARRLLSAARKYLQPISEKPGEHQAESRALLAKLPGVRKPTPPRAPISPGQVRNFEQATQAAAAARDQIQAAEQIVRLLEPRLKETTDATRRAELTSELEQARQGMAQHRQTALWSYRKALELAPADLPADQKNRLMYYNSFMLYGVESYLPAAVLGEFVARQNPDDPVARPSANIAMAAYLKAYEQVRELGEVEMQSVERRLISIAEFLASTWPREKEAQDALITLVSFMVSHGDVEKAQQYLAKIPDDSPRRGEAELRTGQAMWTAYVSGMKAAAKQDGDSATEPQELANLKERAQTTLETGINRLKAAGKSPALLQAILSLAQISIDAGDPEKALELLQDDELGPLALAAAGDATANSASLAPTIYKTALRAFLGLLANSPGDRTSMNQIAAIIDKLKASVGDSPAGRRRLVATYVGLARDLQKQMDILPATGKISLAKGFEAFLNQVRRDANQLNVLNWVAETFYSLGEAFAAPGGQLSTVSRKYFVMAGEIFGEITKKGAAGEFEIDPNLLIQIRMRRAGVMMQTGDYSKSIDEFEQILIKRNSALNVQIEAAKALQAGGAAGNSDMYAQAAKGTRRNNNTGKNSIWGWERIARVVQAQMQKGPEQRAQYEGFFFEAQYNLVRCRLGQASRATGQDRDKYLGSAKRILSFTSGSYPDLGGPEWQQKFAELEQQLQEIGAS